MPKVANDSVTKAEMRRTLPLGDAMPATISRMREIAAHAGDTLLLAEGAPDPDWKLHDVCAEALHHLRIATKAYAEYAALQRRSVMDQEHVKLKPAKEALYATYREHEGKAAGPLGRAAKLRAVTPAGIYAKALVVRSSRTGAAGLAMSLAEDMVACHALRATLWPAGGGDAA